jgi:hypothetical protein
MLFYFHFIFVTLYSRHCGSKLIAANRSMNQKMSKAMEKKTSVEEWNGVPEVVASASPWEIGFAHGSQILNRITVRMENYKELFLETAEADRPESKAGAATYLPSLEKLNQTSLKR